MENNFFEIWIMSMIPASRRIQKCSMCRSFKYISKLEPPTTNIPMPNKIMEYPNLWVIYVINGNSFQTCGTFDKFFYPSPLTNNFLICGSMDQFFYAFSAFGIWYKILGTCERLAWMDPLLLFLGSVIFVLSML